MKKGLSIALIFILLITACKKEEKFCWKCALIKSNKSGTLQTLNPIITTECSKTEKQIKAYEKANTISDTHISNDGATTIKALQIMTCKMDQ